MQNADVPAHRFPFAMLCVLAPLHELFFNEALSHAKALRSKDAKGSLTSWVNFLQVVYYSMNSVFDKSYIKVY